MYPEFKLLHPRVEQFNIPKQSINMGYANTSLDMNQWVHQPFMNFKHFKMWKQNLTDGGKKMEKGSIYFSNSTAFWYQNNLAKLMIEQWTYNYNLEKNNNNKKTDLRNLHSS